MTETISVEPGKERGPQPVGPTAFFKKARHILLAKRHRPVLASAAGLLVLGAAGLMGLHFYKSRSFPRYGDAPPPALDESIASVENRLKTDPQDLATLVELGELHFQKGIPSYPDAINELEQARTLGSVDPRLFYWLGVMYQQLGLYPFALKNYQAFLRNFPDDQEARLLEAKILYQQGRYADAVGEYERLEFLSPKDSVVQENLALSLFNIGQYDRAADVFKRLVSAGGPEALRAYYYEGQIAFTQGRYQESLDDYLKAQPAQDKGDLQLSPGQWNSALAQTYDKLSMLKEAVDSWQAAVKAAPGDSKIVASLRKAKRLYAAQQKEEARKARAARRAAKKG